MIKYFLANRYLVKVNTEKLDKVDMVDYHRNNIDWLWIVDEDGELDGKPVSKGDIIISFFGMPGVDNSKETVIVKDEILKDYYRRFDEAQAKYEAKNSIECDCCIKCDA